MNQETALHQQYLITGGDFSKAGDVSLKIKNLLKELGVEAPIILRAAIAAYEAEMNVIMYAREARVDLAVTPNAIEMVFDDRGPGIEDVSQAMKEGYSTATQEMRELGFGAGMGLPNIKKNADAFEITSRVGQGTRLEISLKTNGKER